MRVCGVYKTSSSYKDKGVETEVWAETECYAKSGKVLVCLDVTWRSWGRQGRWREWMRDQSWDENDEDDGDGDGDGGYNGGWDFASNLE